MPAGRGRARAARCRRRSLGDDAPRSSPCPTTVGPAPATSDRAAFAAAACVPGRRDGAGSAWVTLVPGGGLNRNTEAAGRRRVERREADLERRLGGALREDLHAGRDVGRAVDGDPHRADQGAAGRAARAPARTPSGRPPIAVPSGADLRRRGDRLERRVGRLLRASSATPAAGLPRRVWAGRPGRCGGWRCLSWLDQVHRSVPLRTTSDSPSEPSSASRTWSGPAYQSRSVCEPETSEVRSELPPPPRPGRLGRPRSAFCTIVPDRPSQPGLLDVDEQLRTRVRCGSPPRAAGGDGADRGAAGGEQRGRRAAGPASGAAGRRSKTVMASSMPRVAVRSLRTCAAASADACQAGRMRLLVVEDEVRLARALRRGLTADGFVVEVAARRCRPASSSARHGDFDAVAPRRDAARAVRVRRGPHPARRGELGAGADAVGQGRRARPGRRAGLRRGRLPHQAVLLRRAAGPAAGAAAPARREPRPAVLGAGRRAARPGDPRGDRRRRAGRADPARVRPARVPAAPPRPGGHQGRDPRPRLGRRPPT